MKKPFWTHVLWRFVRPLIHSLASKTLWTNYIDFSKTMKSNFSIDYLMELWVRDFGGSFAWLWKSHAWSRRPHPNASPTKSVEQHTMVCTCVGSSLCAGVSPWPSLVSGRENWSFYTFSVDIGDRGTSPAIYRISHPLMELWLRWLHWTSSSTLSGVTSQEGKFKHNGLATLDVVLSLDLLRVHPVNRGPHLEQKEAELEGILVMEGRVWSGVGISPSD